MKRIGLKNITVSDIFSATGPIAFLVLLITFFTGTPYTCSEKEVLRELEYQNNALLHKPVIEISDYPILPIFQRL